MLDTGGDIIRDLKGYTYTVEVSPIQKLTWEGRIIIYITVKQGDGSLDASKIFGDSQIIVQGVLKEEKACSIIVYRIHIKDEPDLKHPWEIRPEEEWKLKNFLWETVGENFQITLMTHMPSLI